MKIRLDTITISDETRQAFARFYGRKGLAPREHMRQDLEGLIDDYLDDITRNHGETP